MKGKILLLFSLKSKRLKGKAGLAPKNKSSHEPQGELAKQSKNESFNQQKLK